MAADAPLWHENPRISCAITLIAGKKVQMQKNLGKKRTPASLVFSAGTIYVKLV